MNFQESNAIWNQQSFNSIYVVGEIMKLIRKFQPANEKEFEDLYYRSGNERLQCLLDMDPIRREKCNNIVFLKDSNGELSKKEKYIQMEFGRDSQFIRNLAKEFGKACQISTDRALTYVKKRLFHETYLGWANEMKAITILNSKLPEYSIEFADDALDAAFAVDLVIKKQGEVIAGVQVKPKTYAMYKNEVSKNTSSLNKNKNLNFSRQNKKSVLWFYYDDKGNYGFDDKSEFVLNRLKLRN